MENRPFWNTQLRAHNAPGHSRSNPYLARISNCSLEFFYQPAGNAPKMKEEHPPGFDAYAENYDRALAAGLSVTGEHKEYFAAMRIKELGSLLERLDFPVNQVLDFGCGTGSSVPFLLDLKGVTSVTGVDVSEKSLEIARKQDANGRARFDSLQQFRPDGHFDLVFCNGVFHHIPPKDRSSAINTVFNALRSGGIF